LEKIEQLINHTYERNDEKFNKLFTELTLIKSTQGVISQRVEDSHKLLHGNGRKGLVEDFMQHKWVTYAMFAILTAGGATSGGLFFNMLRNVLSGAIK